MIEAVLNNIKELFNSNINTKIDEENVSNDDIRLDYFRRENIYSYGMGDFESPQSFPTLIISANKTDIERYTGDVKMLTHNISILCAVVDDDSQQLDKRIFRYLSIVETLFEQNYTLGGTVIDVIVSKHVYSPVYEQGGVLLKDFHIQAEVHEKDTY